MPIPPQVTGYVVGKRIGRGARHEVWRAWRREDDSEVAIKVPRSDLPAPPNTSSTTAKLPAPAHPNLMAILDYVTATDGRRGLVLPVVEGGSLARLVALRGHLLPGEIVTLMVPLLHAVHELAMAGIVHGDLSPANILLTQDGRPVVADLDPHHWLGRPDDDPWATVGFVAPEVLEGHPPGPAADVYAIAAVAWFALTGEPIAVMQDPTTVTELEGVPASMLTWLQEVLVADPRERPTAALAAQTLDGLTPGTPVEVADDAWGPVTHRVRAMAKEAAEPEPQPRGLQALRRRLSRTAAAHREPVQSPSKSQAQLRSRRAGSSPTRSASSRRPGRAPCWASSRALTGGLLAATVALGVGGIVWSRSAGQQPAPEVITLGAGTASASAAREGTATAATTPADATVDLRNPDAVLRPTELVQALFDRRAAAWAQPRTVDVSTFDASGSWAAQQDSTRFRQAAGQGLSQQGISFTVREASLSSRALGSGGAGQEATIRATVDVSAYSWRGPNGATGTAPARAGAPVDYVVTFTAGGWRFARVESA